VNVGFSVHKDELLQRCAWMIVLVSDSSVNQNGWGRVVGFGAACPKRLRPGVHVLLRRLIFSAEKSGARFMRGNLPPPRGEIRILLGRLEILGRIEESNSTPTTRKRLSSGLKRGGLQRGTQWMHAVWHRANG
jgi:hypothetical protein